MLTPEDVFHEASFTAGQETQKCSCFAREGHTSPNPYASSGSESSLAGAGAMSMRTSSSPFARRCPGHSVVVLAMADPGVHDIEPRSAHTLTYKTPVAAKKAKTVQSPIHEDTSIGLRSNRKPSVAYCLSLGMLVVAFSEPEVIFAD